MIVLIQRVTRAAVRVEGETVGSIGAGLLALVAIEQTDVEATTGRAAERLLRYRVFTDQRGRMGRALIDTGGGLLLVPQFTLAADTRRGLRPDFTPAAPPEHARALFGSLLDTARERHAGVVAAGRFGADMQVELINDGPVTFLLNIS
ncbi:MAG: D-aminoacyl-tRNA deacylase [Thioalkalivibrionaceae bacterium]